MAGRGFVLNDLLEPLGCTLNICPFLNNQGQFSEDKVKDSGNCKFENTCRESNKQN